MDIQRESDLEIVRLLRQWGERADCEDTCEIEALRQFDVKTLKGALLTIFLSGNAQIRIYAIDAMPYIVSQDVMVDLLLPRLHDERAVIRWMACKMIKRYPDPRAMMPLIEVLQQEKNPDTRVIAAEVLGSIGDEQAILALSHSAKNDKGKDFESRSVASAARVAITKIKERRRAQFNA